MDLNTVFGILLGFSAIIVGQYVEGGHILALVQPTAFMIVLGGTIGAVVLQSSGSTFLDGVKMVRWLFFPLDLDKRRMIDDLLEWNKIAKRKGKLAMDNEIAGIDDSFAEKGVRLIIDGAKESAVRNILSIEIEATERRLKRGAKIWEAAGGYSPTIGILGAVMGLIHVMSNLADPSKLGEGIAVAFVATIYGVGFANLVFLPTFKKLTNQVNELIEYRLLQLDGLMAISNGEATLFIENKLQGYVTKGTDIL